MFSGLQEDQLKGALEAMLFVTDEPVSVIDLSAMLEIDSAKVEAALVSLRDEFERENRGIKLREVAGGWRLFTHPAFHDLIERYVISWDTRKLSQAALETLAIVAYCQPITRAGVASVRGVSSDSSINSLVEKGLLREAGTADAPGNPMQYATTRVFLERFGLRSVDDLPDVAQFAPDEETRALIRERLSATSSASSSFARSDDAGETGVADGVSAGGSAGSHTDAASDANTAEQMQRLTDMQLSLLDEEEVVPPQMSSRDLLNAALSSSFGLVDKIDLSKLEFEDDDEF